MNEERKTCPITRHPCMLSDCEWYGGIGMMCLVASGALDQEELIEKMIGIEEKWDALDDQFDRVLERLDYMADLLRKRL